MGKWENVTDTFMELFIVIENKLIKNWGGSKRTGDMNIIQKKVLCRW